MKELTIDTADLTWLGGLARALVRDSQGADDLVQETVVAALKSGSLPTEGRRAWLATIARRLAAQRFRGDANRGARERDAAQGEALPATAELVEHAETAELVVSAARALDEPYARTILLRFMKGWTPEEIARAEGLAVDSVRRRVRRGLELMREELMRRDKRSWTDWCIALVPLTHVRGGAGLAVGAAGVSASGLVQVSLMKKLLFAVPPLAAALFVVRALLIPGDEPDSGEAASLGANELLTEVAVGSGSGGAPRAAVAGSLGKGEDAGGDDGPEIALSTSGAGGFVGRLLTPAGDPVEGAEITVRGWPGNAAKVEEFGLPEDWSDPSGATDADGRFELRFDPPPAFQFIVEARAEGFGAPRWRPWDVPLDEPLDLGDVFLVPSGTVRMHLADAEGEAFSSKLSVTIESAGKAAGPGGISSLVRGNYAAGAGVVVVEGVSAGPNTFGFRSGAAGNLKGGTVEVIAGETVDVDWTYTGPDLDRYLSVSLYSETPGHFVYKAQQVAFLVREADGLELPPGVLKHKDLEPGSYTLMFDHPNFEPLEIPGLSTGESHAVPVRGSASLVLTVLDSGAGEVVTDYSARLDYILPGATTNTVNLTEAGVPADGAFEGVVPQPVVVEVDGGALGIARVTLDDLQPGEQRALTLQLSQPDVLEIRVVGAASGLPVAGLELRAIRAALGDTIQSVMSGLPESWAATTDELGLASLELNQMEALWIAVQDSAGRVHDERFGLDATSTGQVELRIPEPATVQGQVLGSEPEQWAAVLRAPAPYGTELATNWRRRCYGLDEPVLRLDVDETGAFGPARLLPGASALTLVSADLGTFEMEGLVETFSDQALERVLEPGELVQWTVGEPGALGGTLNLDVLLDGEPASGLSVRLADDLATRYVTLVLDGTGSLEASVPPAVYRVELGTAFSLTGELGLEARPAELFQVEAGETTTIELNLVTARRELLVRHADGRPLLEGAVQILPAHAASLPFFPGFGSGGYGAAPIERWMTVGRYRVEIDGESVAEFDWETGEGPLVVELQGL